MELQRGSISTKQQLMALVEDIDLITRQLFETLSQQSSRQSSTSQTFNSQNDEALPQKMNVNQLTDLLLQKNKDLEEKMAMARDQQQLHRDIKLYKAEIAQKNKEIEVLQKHLKDAEHLLSTALYQAKEKLKSIRRARKGAVPSEDIIKYAHKISAACATAAPLNWAPGDPRRPYPQDIEMRCGWLGQINNMTDANSTIKPPPQLGTEGLSVPNLVGMSRSNDIQQPQWGNQSASGMDGKFGYGQKGDEEVEIMSSDSSSSSSSDSSFGND
uniref:mediator of RNA polymerase II transcription subunit 4-like n=1 Tax=Styela clava TaxID=7725 RepID=UPI001939E342|nr:mediator of RNA polymerase II transcription subunit 4-like [Styela clava]